jgi:glycerate dehydrogenase
MKIVIIDSYTLNPGDLSWQVVESFGEIAVFERSTPEQIAERCREAEIVITNKVTFDRNLLSQLPFLKMIIVSATGYNIIDTHAAKQHNIIVCNVPAYGTASVAQHTFALLLELTNRVGLHADSVKNGDWQRCPDFSYTKTPIIELSGKTMGIVGFGHIGQETARIAQAFGMKVLYNSTRRSENREETYVSLEELFAESDVVSLHCPLKPDNHQFVNKNLLKLMKKTAFLINTARGLLIHEQDLADALNAGQLAGAGLDVLSTEPPKEGTPLLTAKNCIITPHNAWVSREARQRIIDTVAAIIKSYQAGNVINVVN